jgi:hypothetical protein
MDDYSIKRLERLVPFFHDYFELDKSERQWIFPALERGIKSTILLLELIEEILKGLLCGKFLRMMH